MIYRCLLIPQYLSIDQFQTSNLSNIYSTEHVDFQNKQFLAVIGDAFLLELFELKYSENGVTISNSIFSQFEDEDLNVCIDSTVSNTITYLELQIVSILVVVGIMKGIILMIFAFLTVNKIYSEGVNNIVGSNVEFGYQYQYGLKYFVG